MTTFIHGSDRGFVLIKALFVLFFLFLLLGILLELEYRKYVRARADYEQAVIMYTQKK